MSITKLLNPSKFKKFLFFLVYDCLTVVASLYAAFLVRFDFSLTTVGSYDKLILRALPIFLVVKLASFFFFRIYHFTWRYVGLRDLIRLIKALIASQLILIGLIFFLLPDISKSVPSVSFLGFPRSIIPLDGFLTFMFLSGIRISKRLWVEMHTGKIAGKRALNTIVVGAGDAGDLVVRNLMRQGEAQYSVCGFVDDNKNKRGGYLHGISILGTTEELPHLIDRFRAEAIIIAITKLENDKLRAIYEKAIKGGIKHIKIVPTVYDEHRSRINVNILEDIKIEDILGRQMVEVDYNQIEKFLIGNVVLVTGAGGSIGSEIAMQACAFNPERLLFVDIDETLLHNLELKLRRQYPQHGGRLRFIVADIRDRERVNQIFDKYRPQVVFHAAAYKHVPMMEYNAVEAVKVNIFGTCNVAKAAGESGARKFVMISTDKAVRPTSIMGATKRMAENICRVMNGGTEYISVRFGNVLGSRGSVLPLFMDQLAYGGPLTVTHPEMKRYFMTIPEAVSLVFQASVLGKGGEVMVLDMGEPVKILKLAEDLIRYHGRKPYEDINIEFVGLRPGEKLFEEILTAEEGTEISEHEKIFRARLTDKVTLTDVEKVIKTLKAAVSMSKVVDAVAIRDILKQHIAWYEA